MSSDGSMLAIGGPHDRCNLEGATWVYQYDGSKYNQLGPKLIGSGQEGDTGPARGNKGRVW